MGGRGIERKTHFYYSHKHSFVTSNNEKLFKGRGIKDIHSYATRASIDNSNVCGETTGNCRNNFTRATFPARYISKFHKGQRQELTLTYLLKSDIAVQFYPRSSQLGHTSPSFVRSISRKRNGFFPPFSFICNRCIYLFISVSENRNLKLFPSRFILLLVSHYAEFSPLFTHTHIYRFYRQDQNSKFPQPRKTFFSFHFLFLLPHHVRLFIYLSLPKENLPSPVFHSFRVCGRFKSSLMKS